MTRLKLEHNVIDMAVALSGGNPGAISALTEMIKQTEAIDPQALLGRISHLMSLDSFEVYDGAIWTLYAKVAKRNVRTMIMLIRAVQLGIAGPNALATVRAPNCLAKLDTQVCAQLSGFARPS